MLGDLDGLSLIPGEPTDYKTSYADANFGEIVVRPKDKIIPVAEEHKSFIRASIRNKNGGKTDKSYQAFLDHGYDMQRHFIFWENNWYVSLYDFPTLVPVLDALGLLMKSMAEEKRLIKNVEEKNK